MLRSLRVHLDSLRRETGAVPELSVRTIRGDNQTLARWYDETNPRSIGDVYRNGAWRTALTGLVATLQQEVRKVAVLPHHFPVAGNPYVTRAIGITTTLKLRDLAIDVEDDLAGAILWHAARNTAQNPFALLLDAYATGYIPLGWTSHFLVYTARPLRSP